ncbi:MAG TPA: NYN domain-containing protein, partial [Anaerolineales bacterium]|nr:NYN domain-containing protein [Anaerolineales bacterium]
MGLDNPENGQLIGDAAVFFDYENIVYSLREQTGKNPNFEILMEKCQEYGRVVLARAYADWSRHGTVIAPLQASGFDPVYVPTYFYDNNERHTRKNAVDIHIAIEAMEVLFTQPQIDTFILLTGDKDFIPLANALRRHGKRVAAIGVKGTTSPYMRQATDDFVFYHELLDEPLAHKRQAVCEDIYEALVKAIRQLQKDGQKTVFPAVKHKMSEMLGSFDEKKHKDANGRRFTRFKDFILEAQRLGCVYLVTTGSVNEVLLPQKKRRLQKIGPVSKSAKAPAKQPPPKVVEPYSGAVENTETAFDLLVWAVEHAQATQKSMRASSIKMIMRGAVHNFDEKKLPDNHFTKFSDFTREAERRGLVQVTGKGILMEIHPVPDESQLPEVPAVSEEDLLDLEPEADSDFEPETMPLEEVQPLAPIAKPASVEDFQPVSVVPETAANKPLVPLPSIESTIDTIPSDIPLSDAEPERVPLPETAPIDETSPYVNDYRLRILVIDALRSYQYPATAYDIGRHCRELGEQRGIPIPSRRLNQLLT